MGELGPKYKQSSKDDDTTYLVEKQVGNDKIPINNNPLYPPNMVAALNTPFDHIDRLLLQDFSEVMFVDGDNYFKGLFQFKYNESTPYGLNGFTIGDDDDKYANVNAKFGSGSFLLDSFTYTPFVDYATTNSKVGIYSDKFLNDYNSGKYESDYHGTGEVEQWDANRRAITSTMYELGNLEQDLQDSKMAFREALKHVDGGYKQVYLYTFCEHIATLFAKLSNIRMCHEIYGFKPPHHEWEGVLALDIWYNLLYKNIDAEYPFDETKLNMNPMKVENGEYIWDNALWEDFKYTASKIASRRRDCVTPRGVLGKIHAIVNQTLQKDAITQQVDGDFPWFMQQGKVYSDASKSTFSKYVNLHLGRAYEAMSAREYCELMGNAPENGPWEKPMWRELDSTDAIKLSMVEAGCDALSDAFSVMRHEKVFNIWNSSTNKVEEFNPANAANYSQSQCAIVIERVFSRLYKYLYFKSTTGEVFQRHINIDSGYKYLTSESIRQSDKRRDDEPETVGVYYDPSDASGVSYLRYLNKLQQYIDNSPFLTDMENTVLKQFTDVLNNRVEDWIANGKYNYLCPLCDLSSDASKLASPRKMRKLMSRSGTARTVEIHFDVGSHANWSEDGVAVDDMELVTKLGKPYKVVYHADDDDFVLDLGSISFNSTPTYTNDGHTVQYTLVGYSKTAGSTYHVDKWLDGVVTKNDFGENQTTLVLHAVWKCDCILKFHPGQYAGSANESGVIPSVVVPGGVPFTLPSPNDSVFYNGPSATEFQFVYHDSNSEKWTNPYPKHEGEEVKINQFKHWRYQCAIKNGNIVGGGKLVPPSNFGMSVEPVVDFYAEWELAYDKIRLMVGDELYCEALVSRKENVFHAPPTPPVIVNDDNSNLEFLMWDIQEGEYLPGLVINVPIVCNLDDDSLPEPVVCHDSQEEPIVCEQGAYAYDIVANAILVDSTATKFNVVFKYLKSDDNGSYARDKVSFIVDQNCPIPRFHIHQIIDLDDGKSLVFRHWKLASGNVSSSNTILSDVVFVGVYDEIQQPEYDSTESIVEDTYIDL